jgi:hypothetical protein
VEFVVDKVELADGFLRVLQFSLLFIPSASPTSSSIFRGRDNRPNSGRRPDWTYITSQKKIRNKREALNLDFYVKNLFQKVTTNLEPVSYRRVLQSTHLHAIV